MLITKKKYAELLATMLIMTQLWSTAIVPIKMRIFFQNVLQNKSQRYLDTEK